MKLFNITFSTNHSDNYQNQSTCYLLTIRKACEVCINEFSSINEVYINNRRIVVFGHLKHKGKILKKQAKHLSPTCAKCRHIMFNVILSSNIL